MAEKNQKEPAVGENPYASPLAAAEMPDPKRKRRNSGCLVLLLAIPLLDTFGMLMSLAGPYWPVVLTLGLGGFACGAALGAYLSAKTQPPTWWSSCHWAIYGLVGMFLPTIIILAILLRLR